MALIIFAPDTGSFGQPGYQVPIVVPQVEIVEPVVKKRKKSKEETQKDINKKLGRRIQKYSSGTEEYKRSHKSLYTLNKKRLAENNRFLVRKIARDFMGKGLSIDDLVGEGNIGLMKAVKRYDPDHYAEKGEIEFSTYAEYWIKQSIRRALHSELRANLPIPYHICSNRNRILKLESELVDQLGRRPTEEEIANKFNETYYPEGPKNNHIRGYHIEALKVAVNTSKSLTRRNGDGEEFETSVYDETQSPDEILGLNEEIKKSKKHRKELDERSRTVISLAYGTDGNKPHNFREIGDMLGYSREMIRKIHNDAIAELKEKMYPNEDAA
jgi:RNA polymerase primary sigma factor